MAEQLYQMTVIASGEVRDKDGNLIEQVPVEITRTVTESEAKAIYQASAAAEETE